MGVLCTVSSTAAAAANHSTSTTSIPSISPSSWMRQQESSIPARRIRRRRSFVRAKCLLMNPADQDPIIKAALKEPVAFFGGVFAGFLRLDLNEEPLKEWIDRTTKASGTTEEDVKDAEEDDGNNTPQQIEIE